MAELNRPGCLYMRLSAGLVGMLFSLSALAQPPTAFSYDDKSVETATYFAAITNLANAVMFSGLGEPLIISPYERDNWLRRAGYITRPPMPDMAIVGPLYAAGIPRFRTTPDFSRPESLAWQPDEFDRRLDPAAQAWALIKITSPEFHLQFHDLPENRLAGLMMVPQARSQAQTLADRLLDRRQLFAVRDTNGQFAEPRPRDQVIVLWAIANLILAGTSERDDYWHAAYRDLTDADDYRELAHTALQAVETLPPKLPADRALAIEALGRFALATDSDQLRRHALDLARKQADALRQKPGHETEALALTIYGLTEASRLLADRGYLDTTTKLFRRHLVPLWDEALGLFHTPAESGALVLTPYRVGAVVAALNSLRWYGDEAVAAEAQRLYPRYFESAIVRSGLLQASPLPLVSAAYRQQQPDTHFAHPLLADAVTTNTAPVFAAEVRFERGQWQVTDPRFRTAEALFLANMLALRHQGRADTFLPQDRLAELR